jgi:cyclase
MEGYDLDLFRSITGAVSIPVIGMGGASNLPDMARAVDEGGVSAVAAGALFLFFGRRRTVLINYPTKEELEQAFRPDQVRPREQIIPWISPIR